MAAGKGPVRRLVDVGGGGIAGNYQNMMKRFRADLPPAIGMFALWSWYSTWPDGRVIYRIAPDITLAGLFQLALAICAAPVIWGLAQGVWSGVKWLRLELQGLTWVVRNDQIFRVLYSRRDGSIQYEPWTRDHRLNNEVEYVRYRRKIFVHDGIELLCWSAGYVALPLAFFYLYEIVGSDVHALALRLHVQPIVTWLYFYVLLVPKIVSVALTVWDSVIYVLGGAFIPGAKVRDAPLPPITIESIREEMIHGAAGFADPDDAATRMAK